MTDAAVDPPAVVPPTLTGLPAPPQSPVDNRSLRGHASTSALSGIVFAGLLTTALVLLHSAPRLASSDADYAAFYKDGNGGSLVTLGLYIIPFAGIAFLWFLAATRILVLTLPNTASEISRFLQLASGVLFVAMLFAGSALVGAVALLTDFSNNPVPAPDIARSLSSAGYGMVFVYGVRAAGMFLLTTTTLARGCGLMSKPLAIISYVAGAFLLISTTFHPAILLVFPAWVIVVSVLAVIRARRFHAALRAPATDAG